LPSSSFLLAEVVFVFLSDKFRWAAGHHGSDFATSTARTNHVLSIRVGAQVERSDRGPLCTAAKLHDCIPPVSLAAATDSPCAAALQQSWEFVAYHLLWTAFAHNCGMKFDAHWTRGCSSFSLFCSATLNSGQQNGGWQRKRVSDWERDIKSIQKQTCIEA
jgi:hypothetical protein